MAHNGTTQQGYARDVIRTRSTDNKTHAKAHINERHTDNTSTHIVDIASTFTSSLETFASKFYLDDITCKHSQTILILKSENEKEEIIKIEIGQTKFPIF